ncbi:MAG: class II aldolase/adducin family protein [Treponema sp.]|nr:class II aldolase/adducin family protein [Treponema sp.]
METIEMKRRIQETALKAYTEKLVAGTSGNVSEFDREQGVMVITPTNVDYRIMRPEDVVAMRLDGTVLEGELKPSSEWKLHAELYKGFDHVNAVIHTHSPRATSFAVLHEIVPVILVEMLPFLGGDIPLAEFGMPGTPEVGRNAVKVMANRNSCLLANHGVVAVGKNLSQAYIRAVYVEDAAAIYHYARQIGDPRLVPAEAVAAMKIKYGLK